MERLTVFQECVYLLCVRLNLMTFLNFYPVFTFKREKNILSQCTPYNIMWRRHSVSVLSMIGLNGNSKWKKKKKNTRKYRGYFFVFDSFFVYTVNFGSRVFAVHLFFSSYFMPVKKKEKKKAYLLLKLREWKKVTRFEIKKVLSYKKKKKIK